jgi:hypothetical protein
MSIGYQCQTLQGVGPFYHYSYHHSICRSQKIMVPVLAVKNVNIFSVSYKILFGLENREYCRRDLSL